ncbi:MAG: hypothetical protein MI757_12625 [Pirellulales bacterium]|nr:hypothetical protein [Pirellulales bacterium]
MDEARTETHTPAEVPTEPHRDERPTPLAVATALFDQGVDWGTFHRQVLGLEGAVRTAFPTPAERREYERQEAFADIQAMAAKLRAKEDAATPEPTRVITVRLPECLHEALRAEAYEMKTSMNKLCITKLLQSVDIALVPCDV